MIPRNRTSTSLVSYSPLKEEEEEEGDGKLASGQSEENDDPAAAAVEDRQVRLGAEGGQAHMTSALGSPKSRRKEQNQLISVRDQGGEGVKNQTSSRTSYVYAPKRK